MVQGYGRGFGFRGASPPWPYVGRGRGGLPRCRYPGEATASPYLSVSPLYTPQMTREQELDFLKNQAQSFREQLGQIEARIKAMENPTTK